jgi:ABC-type uncharacterized transport system substrate-binding protein
MRIVLAALLLLLLPVAARAHPHVLIDAHVVLIFDKGRITALQMGWKFDPVYSSSIVQDFDKDKNGALSAKEIAAVEKEAFQDTVKQQYFTYASIDGQPVKWPKATDFKLLTVKDALVYAFRLSFPAPVDPRRQGLKISTYEESFYIDIDIPNEAAVKLTGDGAESCRATLSEDRDNPLLGGVAFPRKIEVTCAP